MMVSRGRFKGAVVEGPRLDTKLFGQLEQVELWSMVSHADILHTWKNSGE